MLRSPLMQGWKHKLGMRLPAITMLVATLLFWNFYDRYELDGSVLLHSPALADASKVRGDCTETNGLFTLQVHKDGVMADARFRIPEAIRYDRIRVRADIKVEDVVAGNFPWRCARLLLLQYDAAGKWIPGHHGVVAEKDSKDWAIHEDIFSPISGASRTVVCIEHGGLSGTAKFRDIVAEPVKLRASFLLWRWLFAGLWIVLAVLYIPRCRLHRRKLKVLILFNVLAILSGSLMPGKWIEDATERLKEEAARRIEQPAQSDSKSPPSGKPAGKPECNTITMDEFNELIDGAHAAGHFILFSMLCFLVYSSAALERQHPAYFAKVAFDILLFAAITESLQHLTLDRTPGIRDWLTDVYGMLLALLLFLITLGCLRFCPRKRSNSRI